MKKKFMRLTLALCCLLALTLCGCEKIRDYYDPANNDKILVGHMLFSIPEDWAGGEIDANRSYYYPMDGVVAMFVRIPDSADVYQASVDDMLDNQEAFVEHVCENYTSHEFVKAEKVMVPDGDLEGFSFECKFVDNGNAGVLRGCMYVDPEYDEDVYMCLLVRDDVKYPGEEVYNLMLENVKAY